MSYEVKPTCLTFQRGCITLSPPWWCSLARVQWRSASTSSSAHAEPNGHTQSRSAVSATQPFVYLGTISHLGDELAYKLFERLLRIRKVRHRDLQLECLLEAVAQLHEVERVEAELRE